MSISRKISVLVEVFRLVVLVEDALGVELLVPRRGLVHRVVVTHQDLGVSRNLLRGPGIRKDVYVINLSKRRRGPAIRGAKACDDPPAST